MCGYAKSWRRKSRRHDPMVHAHWHQATATEYEGLCNKKCKLIRVDHYVRGNVSTMQDATMNDDVDEVYA